MCHDDEKGQKKQKQMDVKRYWRLKFKLKYPGAHKNIFEKNIHIYMCFAIF